MNPHVLKVRLLANAPPGALQIGEVSAGQTARDHPEIVILAGKELLNCTGLGSEQHHPSAPLGIQKLDAIPLHILPLHVPHLLHPAARRQQQGEGRDRGRHLVLCCGSEPADGERRQPAASVS